MRAALSTGQLERIYGRLASRYDLQHGLITAWADQRGRAMLVEQAVREGEVVLDCGTGTGSTALMAAKKVGPRGAVTAFDLSDEMLGVARQKMAQEGLSNVAFRDGDMVHLPFDDDSFDAVLSSYSLCPVYDPARAAREIYRVTRPGGRIGVAHSTEPKNRLLRAAARKVEDIAWRFPWLSMGCRSIDVLPAFEQAGGRVVSLRRIGVPLWPFVVFVIEKPGDRA